MDSRPLGDSGLTVSRLSLGSWRTFERISRDAGLEVMRAAREAGITFLDDARYDDETGTAPIPTGYSEVVFGELFRAAGWPRDETVVTNKLWWEHWPEESAAEELQGSLGRMGLDHVDVIYANAPINGLELDELVASVGGLITAGLARAWAIVNWPAGPAARRVGHRRRAGSAAALRRAAPLQRRPPRGGREPRDAGRARGLPRAGRRVVRAVRRRPHRQVRPRSVRRPRRRHAGRPEGGPRRGRGAAAGRAGRVGRRHAGPSRRSRSRSAPPSVASVLFGATRPEQVQENVSALELVDHLDEPTWRELRWIGAELD